MRRIPNAVTAALVGALALGPAPAARAGEYAYAALQVGGVAQYGVGADGLLKPLQPAVVPAAGNIRAIAVTPDGRYVYAGDDTAGAIDEFAVGPGGALHPLTPSVATLKSNASVADLAITPDGRSLFAADDTQGLVYQYAIGADGTLTPHAPAAIQLPALIEASAVAVDPGGHTLFVAGEGIGTGVLFGYPIGSDDAIGAAGPTGQLTAPAGVSTYPESIAVTPDGTSLYVTGPVGAGDGLVSRFAIEANGSLTPGNPLTVDTGSVALPKRLAIDPAGQEVYVSEEGLTVPAAVGLFDAGSGGTLALAGTPSVAFPTAVAPVGLAVAPSGHDLYVTDTAGGGIHQFRIAQDGSIALASPPSVSNGLAPQALVVTPAQAPVASFAVTAAPGGAATVFDASASRVSEGGASYRWTFGDGHSDTTTVPAVAHTYLLPGEYAVSLTVSDDGGCSTSFVFTGHVASCNGGPTAQASATVSVPAPTAAGATTTSAGPSAPPAPVGAARAPAAPRAGPSTTVTPAAAAAALACTRADLVLLDVVAHRAHVSILGVARASLVGKRVAIRLLADGRIVARTVVAADGLFSASAPVPAPRLLGRAAARYVAMVAGHVSAAVRLLRGRAPARGGAVRSRSGRRLTRGRAPSRCG